MDGFMPIMTGWDATCAIREREARAAGCAEDSGAGEGSVRHPLIIIGVSGATSSEDERKGLQCGMTDIVSKVCSLLIHMLWRT